MHSENNYSMTNTTIAALCPQQYGPAVYEARGLLMAIDNRPRMFLNECEEIDLPPAPSERRGQDEGPVIAVAAGFALFPNPNGGRITVTTDDDESSYSLLINDLAGRTIRNIPLSTSSSTIDLTTLSQGTYIVVITDDQQRSRYVERVVIAK